MRRPPQKTKPSAFSLVEVVLALGIVSFAVVSVVGLLAVGMDQFRTALDTTICSQIAQRVINDAQQSDFHTLIDEQGVGASAKDSTFTFRAPRAVKPLLRYFDEQGNEIVPKVEGRLSDDERWRVLYHVNVRIRPSGEVPRRAGGTEPVMAQVTVEIAHHAGTSDLKFEASESGRRDLFTLRPGMPVFTYSALVGRND